jgi:hypothetical protein
MIINSGLAEVVYSSGSEYALGEASLVLLGEAGLTVRQV